MLGNEYRPTKLTISNEEREYYFENKQIIADVVTEATIRFNNISTLATSLSLLDLAIVVDSKFKIEFRDITF